MIITESFVWINFPKTASTFVRECLRELYIIPWWNLAKKNRFKNRWMNELELPLIFAPDIPRYGIPTPHGVMRQIPSEFQELPVLSAVRDPVERLVSLYHYGDWKKQDALPKPLDEIRNQYPTFPEIDFFDFYELYHKIKYIIVGNSIISIGPQSHSLLKFFCKESQILNNSKIHFKSWQEVSALFNTVNFISSTNISADLRAHLIKYNFDSKDINFIENKKRVNVSAQSKIKISSELKYKIYEQEWILDLINKKSGRVLYEQLEEKAKKNL
jgi:hypothetical protein